MPESEPANPRGKGLIIGIAVLALFAIGYALTLYAYFGEAERRKADIADEGSKDPNHVNVIIKLVSADLVKGDIPARLEFEPHGDLVNADGTLTRDLRLYLVGTTSKREVDFAKGKRMSPTDVVVDIYDGDVGSYPFDQHDAEINVAITDAAKEKQLAGSAPPPPAGEEAAAPGNPAAAIPVAVDFFGSIQGYDIKANRGEKSEAGFVDTDITISRAPTVKFFSIFIMVMQWGLTIGLVCLVVSVLRGRKIELAMFTFTTALLFAFPTVRNAQPGIPMVGTLSDFIAFFWAEFIIVACLLTLVATFLRRPAGK